MPGLTLAATISEPRRASLDAMVIKRAAYCLPALLALAMLAGCGSEADNEALPGGGTDARAGRIVIDDIWVDGPHGLNAGADAPLRLEMTNEATTTDDALVGVSTPIARRTRLERDGHPVPRIVVDAQSMTDLEWHTGVELQGLRRNLEPGQWFPVTLTFGHAGSVTALVTVGQLAKQHIVHGNGRRSDRGTL